MMPEHKTELRDRIIKDNYCLQPGCEYYGELAVQGHCHSVPDDLTDKYIQRIDGDAEQELKEIKEIAGDAYLEHLESYYVSAVCNWKFALDELVSLRRENARLKKLARTPGHDGE